MDKKEIQQLIDEKIQEDIRRGEGMPVVFLKVPDKRTNKRYRANKRPKHKKAKLTNKNKKHG